MNDTTTNTFLSSPLRKSLMSTTPLLRSALCLANLPDEALKNISKYRISSRHLDILEVGFFVVVMFHLQGKVVLIALFDRHINEPG